MRLIGSVSRIPATLAWLASWHTSQPAMVASRDDEKGWDKIRVRIGSNNIRWIQTGSEITNEEV